MSVRCAGTKRDGSPCTATVEPPQRYCWWHSPEHADQRKRAASKAGRSKPSREIRDLKRRISQVIDDVLQGKRDRGRAAVAIQGFNTLIKTIQLEREVYLQDELAAEVEELKRVAQQEREGGRAWAQ